MKFFKRFFKLEEAVKDDSKEFIKYVEEEVKTSVRDYNGHDYLVMIGDDEFMGSGGCWRVLPDFYDATYKETCECIRLLKKAQYEGKVKK